MTNPTRFTKQNFFDIFDAHQDDMMRCRLNALDNIEDAPQWIANTGHATLEEAQAAFQQWTNWSWKDDPELMAQLNKLQNSPTHCNRDIVSIVGMMKTRRELLVHIERNSH